MPKVETKTIQKELEQDILWPVYWIYGPEKIKAKGVLAQLRKTASEQGWSEETLDGKELDALAVLTAAQSLGLWGGCKLILIQDSHHLKNAEKLAELLGPSQKLSVFQENRQSICVFISKDLDGRKKFSKLLVDKAAVIPCEEVKENEREEWIESLAKKRKLNLSQGMTLNLSLLDPWSLEIVDQELEKLSLAGLQEDVLLDSPGRYEGSDRFVEEFLNRNLKNSLSQVAFFAAHPDEVFPLLGLLAWNVRHLALYVGAGKSSVKINPYLAERFQRWSKRWKLKEIIELQSELAYIDFSLKQTPLMGVGLWTHLVSHFCH